ncbi:hypothetical protein RB195_024933 [Necator americanus]|uniref:Reverse transcriptase domain-containing protein n=1 Tax=Necator americanus TaxID=51031 RepID=A0ABR1EQ60_NECAM
MQKTRISKSVKRDLIHTVSKLIELSQKMTVCLTFIDIKKAFSSIENEAFMEALYNQDVITQPIKAFRELYSNITPGISPFFKNIIFDLKREVQQDGTLSPKVSTATLENAIRRLEWSGTRE